MGEIITNMDLTTDPVLLEVHMMEKGRVLATLALKETSKMIILSVATILVGMVQWLNSPISALMQAF